jgi:PadR family transcriptional regulator PadR
LVGSHTGTKLLPRTLLYRIPISKFDNFLPKATGGVPLKSVIARFFLGFIKIHILHHASEGPVYGMWLIDELKRHGYDLSPGTLYPILHSLEQDGLLRSSPKLVNGKVRKYYRTTPRGRNTVKEAMYKVRELLKELGDGRNE